jgi:hypothetical protein
MQANDVQSKVPDDDPLMIAWKAWQGSEAGRNASKWGSAISVSIVDNQSTVSHPHLDGALWNAFMSGYQSAKTCDD